MRPDCLKSTGVAILLATAFALPASAQDVHVELGKRSTAIPKVCESVVPATIDGKVDVPALMNEANCKGSGDMLVEYFYVMTLARREKNKKGQVKEDTKVYEVYIPVLKSGTRARGVLLLTSHNGVPVPKDEMERERLQAGKRLEKAEDEIEREAADAQPERAMEGATGMLPLGTYPRTGISRATFGFGRGGVALDVRSFLKTCELKLVRREQVEGRETLVLSFAPRMDAQFSDKEKYIAQLGGTIWIDAQDRIVTRLAAWPLTTKEANSADSRSAPEEKPPAVYLEMAHVPEGVWLPKSSRINGADYPKLFDHVSYDLVINYSEYKRFSTEAGGVEIEPPKAPR